MNIVNTLHKISHLKWVFLLAEIYLIFYAFTISSQPENIVNTIGMLLLVAGIQLGLESLSDVKKMSQKEIKKYQERKNVKIQAKVIYFSILILAVISLLFFSLKFFGSERNKTMFNAFFSIGLNLWALILGLLCLLKNIYDKDAFAISQLKS